MHKVDDSHKHQAMSYILCMAFSQHTFCSLYSPEKNLVSKRKGFD